MGLDERPESLEVCLGPIRIDHEVSRDAVAELARDLECRRGPIDRGVLAEVRQSGIGRGFEPEEDVELSGDRPPGFEQFGVPGHDIHAGLNEQPVLSQAFPDQRVGQRATP